MIDFIYKLGCQLLLIIILSINVQAQFVERSMEVGIDHRNTNPTTICAGVALFDMNNDNLLDIFLVGGTANESLYINNGSTFDRVITYLGPEDFDYFDLWTIAVASGDVNNDGYDDLFLGTFDNSPSILFINKKNGRFDAIPGDITNITSMDWTAGASMGDINKDGLLDIFVQNYVDTAKIVGDSITHNSIYEHVGTKNNLFINQGDHVFQDRSLHYGADLIRNSLTSSFTDFDNDTDVDIYVVNDFGAFTGPNEFYRNNYPTPDMDEISEQTDGDVAIFGMGLAVGDYDGDLDLDYYMTNIGRNVLLENVDGQFFIEATDNAGVADSSSIHGRRVGWGTGFFDYDNDADLDLYISNGYLIADPEISSPLLNPNSLYRNNGDGSFTDVSEEMNFNDPSTYRGSAFGDLNNDGRLDVVLIPMNQDASPPDKNLKETVAVYYNITENENNWVKFKLIGVESNRNGFGSHVYLYDNSGRIQLRECDGGSSHASSNSPYIHFGLGTSDAIDSVVVKWNNGNVDIIKNPAVNLMHEIVESAVDTVVQTSILEDINLKIKTWPNPAKDYLVLELPHDLDGLSQLGYNISNLDGQVLAKGRISQSTQRIDLPRLPEGAYFLNLLMENRIVTSRQFIRKNQIE